MADAETDNMTGTNSTGTKGIKGVNELLDLFFIVGVLIVAMTIAYRAIAKRYSQHKQQPWTKTPELLQVRFDSRDAFDDYKDEGAPDIEKLKGLMMTRAIHAVQRYREFIDERQGFGKMKANLPEEMVEEYEKIFQETEEEMEAIVMESDEVVSGWSKSIFPQAVQLIERSKQQQQQQSLQQKQQQQLKFEKLLTEAVAKCPPDQTPICKAGEADESQLITIMFESKATKEKRKVMVSSALLHSFGMLQGH